MKNLSYSLFPEIKHALLSPYPTTIRRAVVLKNIISIDHSVNLGLYEQWMEKFTTEIELKNLHNDMAKKISEWLDNPTVKIEFIHIAPTTIKCLNSRYRSSYAHICN